MKKGGGEKGRQILMKINRGSINYILSEMVDETGNSKIYLSLKHKHTPSIFLSFSTRTSILKQFIPPSTCFFLADIIIIIPKKTMHKKERGGRARSKVSIHVFVFLQKVFKSIIPPKFFLWVAKEVFQTRHQFLKHFENTHRVYIYISINWESTYKSL